MLSWDNVRWNEREDLHHEIFGSVDVNSAHYVCPHCGCIWDDAKKNRAVRHGVWRATAPFLGTADETWWVNKRHHP